MKNIKVIKKFRFKKPNLYINKYSRGVAAISAGSYGFAGAAMLSAKAASLCGAGLIKMELIPNIYNILAANLETAVFCERQVLLNKANALLIGPGCGSTVNLNGAGTIPTVLDADALNYISSLKNFEVFEKYGKNIIITPHEGEMARLLNVSSKEISLNRQKYAKELSLKYHVITVLKGKNTIVCDGSGNLYINKTDSPVLATAGSGDVLAGIIVALLAQGYSLLNAALGGVYIHGLLGVLANKKYGIATNAQILIKMLPNIVKKLS